LGLERGGSGLGGAKFQVHALISDQSTRLLDLECLSSLRHLAELSTVDNPVVRGGHCRPAVVLTLPRLRVLDGQVVTADERAEAELAACGATHAPAPPSPSSCRESPWWTSP
jgi:hypothetical protein